MEWQIIIGAAALGCLALALAIIGDRRSRQRARLASLPPDRNIANLPAEATPAYISAEQANTPPRDAPKQILSTAEHDELSDAGSRPQLLSGWADARFVTDQQTGWAVLHDPLVVVADMIGSVRELLPLVEKADTSDRAFVIIAGSIDPDTLDTLAVNVVQGKRRALLVAHPASELQNVAADLGIEVIDRVSLQNGWCPPNVFAQVMTWASSKQASWYIR